MVTVPITPPLPPLGPDTHLQQAPTWTDLVQEENGSYKQTSQHPEIYACLSATVKRATANLVLVNAFPSLHDRDAWVLDSLMTELLIRQNNSYFIGAVAERVKIDEHYLNCLISMVHSSSCAQFRDSTIPFQVNGRWSSFRQGIIQAARDIVLSKDCSYSVRGSGANAVTAALALLEKDSFHFGRTSTVSSRTGNV